MSTPSQDPIDPDMPPRRPGLRILLSRGALPAVAVLFVLGLSLTVFQLVRNHSILVERTALQHAKVYSDTLRKFRSLYNSEVVETVREQAPELRISHDYLTEPNTIPLPISLSREIEQQVGMPATRTMVYSPFPFEWRADEGGLRDEFAEDAWEALRENPDEPFYRIETYDGVRAMRYAQAEVMQEECVSCHNDYEGSPRTDWQSGDVRGVLEVVYPIDQAESLAEGSVWETLGILTPMLLLALAMLGLTNDQYRRWSRSLERRIEAQQRAQEALKRNKARYRTVLETAPDCILILTRDGEVGYLNRESGPEWIPSSVGESAFTNMSESASSAMREAMHEALATGEVQSFDMVIRGRWYSVRVKPLGEDDQLLVFSTDTTSEHLANQMLRMQTLGELAGGVAHDVNNLLTVILSFGTFAIRRIGTDHAAYSDTKRVLDAAQRGESLTRRLLDFSAQGPTNPQVLAVNDVVQGVHELVRPLVGEQLDLRVKLGDDLQNVCAESDLLDRVLVNLAMNARDAMPEGGTLTISTSMVTIDDERAADRGPNLEAGRYVRISVTDTGIGMDEETRARVFEPFFTTKGPSRGTGLGLTTCWMLVRKAGGDIEVLSETGHGTTMNVYLPGVDEPATLRGASEVSTPQGNGESIIVAEDEDDVRELVVRTLEEAGYNVLEACDGREALDLCEVSPPGTIHMLLTDVVMPELTGPEVAREALRLHPGISVLYMSGYADDHSLAEADARAPLVRKPLTPELITRRVRASLDENSKPTGARGTP